jgi:integrase
MQLSEFAGYFVSMSTYDLRRTTLERIYKPAFKSLLKICGDKSLESYTVRDIEMFKMERLRECSPVTFNIAFRTLKAAFNQALKWEIIRTNPFSKLKQVKVPEKQPLHFSKEEFSKFLALVVEPILKAIFILGALTGMRQGELLNLQWSNIDFEQRVILIANQGDFVTKTGRIRTIPMNNNVFDLLRKLKSQANECPHIFNRNGEMFKQSYIEHKFKTYVRKADLNDALKFHSLRHTFATWLVQSGASLYEVQKLMGHSDIKTTQIYAHLMASELHSTVNKINLSNN